MKKNTNLLAGLFFILSFSLIFFSGCKEEKKVVDSFGHIPEGNAKVLLQKAIAAAGGLENWNKISSLYFKKDYQLFLEDGTVENEANQIHQYGFFPKKIKIQSEHNKEIKELIFENGKAKQTINGQLNKDAKQESLMNSIYTSTFVIEIPFKFLDKGAEMTYDGIDTLETGEIVEVLKINYQPQKYDNLTTADIWWLFFDKKDARLHGYMVKHKDHFSYVKNLKITEANGFLFPEHRKSYRVDEERNILYLRAEYFYKDYKVEM